MSGRYVRRPIGGPDDPRHGTNNGYGNLGCRCGPCTEANTQYCLAARAKKAAQRTCPNCGGPGNYLADGTCATCYGYKLRTGRNRPTRDKACRNCGGAFSRYSALDQCPRCHIYETRRGRPRPRHLWDSDMPCMVCSHVETHLKGRCYACWAWLRRHGTERPNYMWGAHPAEDYRPVGFTWTDADRFWARVDTSQPLGCWRWNGYTAEGGGRVSWKGRYVYAHRIAYLLTYGHAPAQLASTCGTTGCVNPNHWTQRGTFAATESAVAA